MYGLLIYTGWYHSICCCWLLVCCELFVVVDIGDLWLLLLLLFLFFDSLSHINQQEAIKLPK